MRSTAIAVVAEHRKGELADITLELLACGRELADSLKEELLCIVLTDKAEPFKALPLAADRILIVQHEILVEFNPEAYVLVLDPLLRELKPRLLLLGNTSSGMDMAGPLSTALDARLVGNAIAVSSEDGRFVVTSMVYGGKIVVRSEIADATGIILLSAGSYPKEKGMRHEIPTVELKQPPAEIEPLRIRFLEFIEPEVKDVDISKLPVLVAAGRGIQSEDSISMVEELAEVLGGAVCATRPLVDQGWLPKTRLVGRSGMIVRPRLYLSLGVSGAPEHVEGMRDSEMVVAVNSDPEAPIFNIADYGVVADLFEVVPELVERIKRATGKG